MALSREDQGALNAFADFINAHNAKPDADPKDPKYLDAVAGFKELVRIQNLEPTFGEEARAFVGGASEMTGVPQALEYGGRAMSALGMDAGKDVTQLGFQMGGLTPAGEYPQATRAAREGGRTFGSNLLPLGILQNVAKGATAVRGINPITPSTPNVSTLQRVTDPMIQPFVRSPLSANLAEQSLAGAASAGTIAAEEIDPDNALLRTGLELGSSLTLGLFYDKIRSAGRFGSKAGSKAFGTLNRFAKSMTKSGRQSAAGDVIMRVLADAGEDPAAILKRLNEGETLARADALSEQTPAQFTGSRGLAQLEQFLSKGAGGDRFKVATDVRGKNEVIRLEKAIADLNATGDADAVQVAAQLRKDLIEEKLDQRLSSAEGLAAQSKAALQTGVKSKRVSSERVRAAINFAIKKARADETKLWKATEQDVPIEIGSLSTLRQELIDNGDILPEEKLPSVLQATLRRYERLGKRSAESEEIVRVFGDGAPAATTVNSGELITFRSRILALAREEATNGQFRQARIYNKYADRVLDLIENVPGSEDALAFSRELNNRLTTSIIGDITATRSRGAAPVRPEQTLEAVISGSPEQRTVAAQEVVQGTTPIPSGDQTGRVDMTNPKEATEAIGDFLQAMAVDTFKGNKVDPSALDKFVKANGELLQQYPELLKIVQNSSSATRALDEMSQRVSTTRDRFRNGVFGKLINAENPEAVINEALKIGGDSTPMRNLRTLAMTAKRGGKDAVDGLRSGVINHVMSQDAAPINVFTNPISTGKTSLKNALVKNGVMSKQQADAFEILLKGLQVAQNRTQLAGDVAPLPADVLGKTSNVVDLMARYIGSWLATKTPMTNNNTSLIIAYGGARAMRGALIQDPVLAIRDTLKDILLDRKLTAKIIAQSKPYKPAAPIIGDETLEDGMNGIFRKYAALPAKLFVGGLKLAGKSVTPQTLSPTVLPTIAAQGLRDQAENIFQDDIQ